jgi:hypothetical protein
MDIGTAIREFMVGSVLILDISARIKSLVDGLGAPRIAEVLCPTPPACLKLRPTHRGSEELRVPTYKLMAGDLPLAEIRFEPHGHLVHPTYSFDEIAEDRRLEALLIHLGHILMHEIRPKPVETSTGWEHVNCTYMRLGEGPMQPGRPNTTYSIAILSDRDSWLNTYIADLVLSWLKVGHHVLWVHEIEELSLGDFCFYLGCGRIVDKAVRSMFRHNLVVHESALPKGKGWSPLTWQILAGECRIPVTLFEAADQLDSGVIYDQDWLEFEGHELIDELRRVQAGTTLLLCMRFIDRYPKRVDSACAQVGEPTFYPRRKPEDSRLDPAKSINAQFDLLRVVDNVRYPAYFDLRGFHYRLMVEKFELPERTGAPE